MGVDLVACVSGEYRERRPADLRIRIAPTQPVGGDTTSTTSGFPTVRRGGEVGDDVVLAAARGDRAAFTTIISTYERRLRVTAYQVLRDVALVDDALQDVFVAAYRGLPSFRGQAALGTWLTRITFTTCAQHLRRGDRRPRLADTELAEHDTPAVADCSEVVGERDRLRLALTGLTAEQRFLVLLVDRDGYGYREAARLLGVPRGTVASRLSAARAQLRCALDLGDAAQQGR
jgi:RNA polymerase sigma-70 factor (ECF subfamily)